MSFDVRTISTAALAYLGDAVLEVLTRRRLVEQGYASSKSLNQHAAAYVTAEAQAAAMERLLPLLAEEEAAVFRRGRNIGHTATPRHATVAQYRTATGMEALFGYLSLTGQTERAMTLFGAAFPEQTKTTIKAERK